jgi:fructosamine-3-kinase
MSFADAVRAATGRQIRGHERVGGGDINDAFRVQFEDESFAFVKTRADVAPGEYEAEAAGLRWLAEPGVLRVPDVLGVSDTVLVLDWVDEGRRGDLAAFGAGLAEVHAAGADTFGGVEPLRIGPLLLPNDLTRDWPTFYAENRLRPLLEHLAPSGREAVDRVCEKIADLAGPPEPPARLHGDLWSGNVLWDRQGHAWLIDPAAYGGHREIDLAMLQLFGDPGRHFFAAYDERFPLAPGREERVPLYQLFPLLVHAALFGGGYGASAERAARVYL